MLTAAASAPAAGARPLQTGITNLNTAAPLAFQRTRGAGATFVRIQLYWGGTAPERKPASWQPENPNDPNYSWGQADEAVINAVAAGLVPVLQVDGTPEWAQRCEGPTNLGGPALCDPDPMALREFAVAAARRFSGRTPGVPRVQYWQALNEPNLSIFFFPQYDTSGRALSPELYRDLINGFYAGIKSVDPANLVLAAGLGPIAIPKFTIGPMRFARQMLCMRGSKRPKPTAGNCGGGVHFDIFAIQPYTTGNPAHEGGINDVQLGDLNKLQALIRAADRAGRIVGRFKRTPLWITEFSWDSRPPDPGGLPMKIETQWTAEALHVAWRAGVTRFFWYTLRDKPQGPPKEANESGLYFRGPTLEQDVAKPVLDVFRFPFVAYQQGNRRQGRLRFWGRTPNSRNGRVAIQVLKRGRWRRVLVTRADKAGIIRGVARTRYGRGGHGRVRAVYRGDASVSFPMKPVGDFYHPPFG
ncbi:MAG TPA: hypothetical protein VFC52_01450 [Solirubrobacterales bacterium]|nr:hypothetical protein [Solirubrobacterales bacterium]